MKKTRGRLVRRLTPSTLALLAGGMLGAAPASENRPTEPFRREHAAIQRHLQHVDGWVGTLRDAPSAEQRQTMRRVVAFFEEHITPHAHWEEQVLYPAVDGKVGQRGAHPFTESMRYEHRIVKRWVDALATEAAKPRPDVEAFARQTDRLLGLIQAHFEEEEQVLLPILDRTMTPEEFKKLAPAEHTGH